MSGQDTSAHPAHEAERLRLRRLGIDTYQEAVVYMRSDCPVCRAEGFETLARVEVRLNGRSLIATVHDVATDLLREGEASLSEHAWRRLGAREGDAIEIGHPRPLESLKHLRAKVYGGQLPLDAWREIVDDVAAGRYSELHLAALVTACAGGRLDLAETASLARAMLDSGERLQWRHAVVADKHCVGGLPGNRTTMIVVPIVAACGVLIPKTSSRAITSPAGTADAMEAVAPVDLDLAGMRRVVDWEGGCIVWGDAARLSPADDILIRVERPLDFDSEGQLVASVLSKKSAAGATHVLIDVPVGPSAKFRTPEAAERLAIALQAVATQVDLNLRVLLTDGTAPVGRGIGPALEARDVLAVLRREPGAPVDLRERALMLAGALLEFCGRARPGEGEGLATLTIESGRALRKFEAICVAQGAFREPPRAPFEHVVLAESSGRVASFDNRRLARLAKLAGAPRARAAGILLHAGLGASVSRGEPLFTLHTESRGERDYALQYLRGQPPAVTIAEAA